jgi:Leucine-rich repeat (LRR) protein
LFLSSVQICFEHIFFIKIVISFSWKGLEMKMKKILRIGAFLTLGFIQANLAGSKLYIDEEYQTTVDSIKEQVEEQPDVTEVIFGYPYPYAYITKEIIDALTGFKEINTLNFSHVEGLNDDLLNMIVKKFPDLQTLRFNDEGQNINIILLEKLEKLESLTLKNWLNIPESISKLENLKYLNLYGSGIKNLEPLAKLNLKFLAVSCDKIKDFTPLQKMSTLRHLEIYKLNHLEDNNPSIQKEDFFRGLEGLISLNLMNCGIKNLKSLKNLEKLTVLKIYNCDMKDLTGTEKFQDLKVLDLSNNTCLRNLNGVENFENLERLDLNYNFWLKDLEALYNVKKLKILSIIFSNEIPDEQIKKLKEVFPDLKLTIRRI